MSTPAPATNTRSLKPAAVTPAERVTRLRYEIYRDVEAVSQLAALAEELQALTPEGRELIRLSFTAAAKGEELTEDVRARIAAHMQKMSDLNKRLELIRSLQAT